PPSTPLPSFPTRRSSDLRGPPRGLRSPLRRSSRGAPRGVFRGLKLLFRIPVVHGEHADLRIGDPSDLLDRRQQPRLTEAIEERLDRKSTRLNSSHLVISY